VADDPANANPVEMVRPDGPSALDGVSGFMGMRWDDPQTVRLEIRPELINGGGMLSGVVTYALVDYCMGSTLWAQTTERERIATIGISINYIRRPIGGNPCVGAINGTVAGKTADRTLAPSLPESPLIVARLARDWHAPGDPARGTASACTMAPTAPTSGSSASVAPPACSHFRKPASLSGVASREGGRSLCRGISRCVNKQSACRCPMS
jgi:hypothetical protein